MDLLDHRPLQERRDDLQPTSAAVRTPFRVDVKHALEQPRHQRCQPRRVSIFISRGMTVCSSGVAARFNQLPPGAVRDAKRLMRGHERAQVLAAIRTAGEVFTPHLRSP